MSTTDVGGQSASQPWAAGAEVLGGRFKILEVLGQGGVTTVYRAEHVHLGQKVALKVLRQDLGVAEGQTGRFREEAKRLALVNHPAVVRVVDFGVEGPLLYLVTELAPGKPLARLLTGEPQLPDRAVALLCQVAEGLAAIHAQGLVHRDLGPQNVFVEEAPDGPRARLVDFGIARLVDPETSDARVTLMMKPVGLPQYMSPEQARGAPTDARSDLYSFGVLAFHVLSGRLPFEGPGPADYMVQHQEQPAPPLGQVAPHLLDHVKLCQLVAQCLEKDPSRRPAGARELAQRLGRVPQVGEPTILMEALQLLPPALPVASKAPPPAPAPAAPPAPPAAAAPVVAPSPAQAARGPLLPSLVMPAPSPSELQPAPSLMPPLPPPPPPAPPGLLRTLKIAGAGALAALVIAGVVFSTRANPARDARAHLEGGRAEEALSVLQEALKDPARRGDPRLLAMLAATMHRLDRHRDEATLFREELAPKSPEVLDPLVLAGLLEDLGKKEDGPARPLLQRLPKEDLYPVLKDLAEERPSARQWGALRYLDLEQSASGLDLVKLYVAALDAQPCPARRVAAKRLGQLGDADATEALAALKDAPRAEGPDRQCGQDEAGAALKELAKKKP